MAGSVGRGSLSVSTLALLFIIAIAGPASASCAEPGPLGQALGDAHAVFVGTVTELEYENRVATFNVDDIWTGDIGATVTVSGGPRPSELERAAEQGLTVATSVDRTYVLGETYLVVSYAAEGRVLLDTNCSATQVYNAELDQHRPTSAHSPSPAENTSMGLPTWAASVLVLIAFGLMARTVLRTARKRRLRAA